MTEQQGESPEQEQQIVIVGPDGQPMGSVPASALAVAAQAASGDEDGDGDGERAVTDLVEQPAKVMRIGSMIRQLLEEVKAAPLDEASRNRLKDIHQASIAELEQGWPPSWSRSCSASACPSPRTPPRRRASCASPRPSWSAGSRVSSTGSRPRSTPSRCRRGRSSSRCGGLPAGQGHPGAAQPGQPGQPGSRVRGSRARVGRWLGGHVPLSA